MTSRCVGRRQCRQSGFALLEVLIVMVIVSMLLSQAADWYMQYNDQQVAKVVSTQHQQVDKAAAAYIKKNYTTLMAGTLPATKDIDVLRAEGFLPDYSFDCSTTPCKLRNAYSQEYKLVIRKAGTAPNQRLEALVLTFGGQTLDKGDMIRVARNLGASGGYVEAGGAVGSMKGWAIPNLASAFGAGANVGDGHLASAIYFVDGTQSSDYLYRNAVPGKPELNRMGTALDMGSNSINNANAISSVTVSTTGSITSQTGGITATAGDIKATAGWLVAGSGIKTVAGGSWVDNGSVFSTNRSISSSGNIGATGSITAGGNVNAAGVVTGGLTVNGNANVSGTVRGATVNSTGAMTAAGRLTTNEYLYLGNVATSGAACALNGLVAKDSTGALLSCQSGTWKKGGDGKPRIYTDSLTAYGEATKNIGVHDSCVVSGFFVDDGACYAQAMPGKQWRIYIKPFSNSVSCYVTCYTWD